ncbi:MAG: hypothetical protein QM484_06955 [Woeseiaceae bacterium]
MKNISVELFIATSCHHCPTILNEFSSLVKNGKIASLNVTNIAVENTRATELNIRSVPWFSLSTDDAFMIFNGQHSEKEINEIVDNCQSNLAMQVYIIEQLSSGQMMLVNQAIKISPNMFSHVVTLLENEETSMDIRIGLDALTEMFENTEMLQEYAERFKEIISGNVVRLQIDALHYLALTGDVKHKDFISKKMIDKNKQIKEAAMEACETLMDFN